jgi:hypothetical protein
VLSLYVSGGGTVTGSYTTGSGSTTTIAWAPCTPPSTCTVTANVPLGAVVTLTGASPNFVGFQRPYCDVKPCDSPDPEWYPPSTVAWSPDPFTFTLVGRMNVIAKW